MPVYLFTSYAEGPRSADGQPRFVLRNEPTPPRRGRRLPLAESYRQAIDAQEVLFDGDHQRRLMDTVMDEQHRERFRCFGVAADETRLHMLVAWDDGRSAADVQASIRGALVRGLNREFGRRAWLAPEGNAKRVRNRTQFDYLLENYLPHTGQLSWTATTGVRSLIAASA